MASKKESGESPATTLCKSCGLCCTGHLFVWSKLRSAELDNAQSLGLNVIREPGQRGFNQPCPLWEGKCTIYETPHYPRFCHTYKCKLLKQVIDENIPLSDSLKIIQETRKIIDELELLLPDSPMTSFRERLVTSMEQGVTDVNFRLKADALVDIFDTRFGVNDFLDGSEA
ncbi:MAG TPA: hypothetical protein DCX53_03265 [Anaerolineae bacterium]|nr:hypothetical protein [Anaerolineae bacterium]